MYNIYFGLQEDYRRTVTEIDEKEYISLKIIVSELRNQYVSIAITNNANDLKHSSFWCT